MFKSALKRSADIERLSQAVTSHNSRTNVNTSTSPGLGMASAPTEEATVVIFWMIFLGYWLVIDRFILCLSIIQNV